MPGRHRDGSARTEFRNCFLSPPHNSPEETEFFDEPSIPGADRWSWEHIQWPYSNRTFESAGAWQKWLLSYLREDVVQAAQGNVDGAVKAALDVLRNLRNELRLIVDHSGLPGTSRPEHLDHWYTPFNAFLSIGRPRQRIWQMVALIEAGILHALGPRLDVQAEDGAWLARILEIPNSTVRVTTLIEARLPEACLQHTADDLLEPLLKTGQPRLHTIDVYVIGGIDVTLSPYHLIDDQGRAHARRFVYWSAH